MATIYCNPTSGNDANPGTAGSPKRYPQALFDGTALNPGDIVEIQTGTHSIPDFQFLLRINNYKRGNASNYITLQAAAGCTINMGRGGSGVEGYGSNRFLRFKNLVINVRASEPDFTGFFNEGIFFNGRETSSQKNSGGTGTGSNQNPDGLGCCHISIEGCTIKGVSSAGGGTGYHGRNSVACIGGDYISVLDCSLSYGSENDIGGGGSGISLHQPYSYDTAPGIHMRAERNKIFMQGNPATANPATDRNGIILDEYHQVGLSNQLVGDTLIANNIIINTAGRGIHSLLGGKSDSKIAIINNTVVAPFGYALGGSVPQCGIGGYGDGRYGYLTFFNNLVIGDQGRFNYDWLSWDAFVGALQGARNWSYNGNNQFSPPATEPSGWLYSTANPQLVNPLNNGTGNYSPQAGSPLIAAGIASFNGWSAPTLDFNSTTRTGGVTIGAIQINSGAGTAPTANFTFAPALPGAGSQVTFTDTSSGAPNSFQWDFGDGTTSLVTNPVKIYTTAGTFTVAHTVSNTFGSNTVSKSITVAPAGGGGPPVGGTPGVAVDLYAMFNSRYPCAASLIWVSGGGNDSNPGTQAAPKQTIQGAVNAAGAGTRIMVRAGVYDGANFTGKNGTNGNWIQVVGESGARIQGNGDGQGAFQLKACSFIAFYGLEMTGIYQGGNDLYEVALYAQQSAHSMAVWNCHIHNWSAHAFATSGAARFDVCYNRLHHLAKFNPYQTSALSAIGMPNVGTAWSDGYMNHVIGNVIDATWIEESVVGGQGNLTDGNGLIMDYSGGYNGRTLVAHNLIVGCGGRGIHALGTAHVDAYLNTTVDNVQNLPGGEDCELSVKETDDCHFAWNVAAARPGLNRVGLLINAGSSTWSDTVFLRGTGSGGSDPAVGANNNVNKTGTGPSGYFQQYQAGQSKQTSITNVAGFRPTAAQVSTFTPSASIRSAVGIWPDALGFLRPASGTWAYGAFEASTSTAPPDPGGGGGGPIEPPPPTGTAINVEAESGTVGGGAAIVTDFPGYLGTGYVGYFGVTGDFNQVSVSVTTAGTYAFRIRFGNGDSGSTQCQVRVIVNGTEVAILTLPKTAADWSDSTRFQHTTPVSIQLNAGANTVRIEHTGSEYSYADLDRYVFEGADGGTPSGQAPVAAFAFSPQTPNINQSVSFVDQSTNTPTSWAWNFGDGTVSTARNPVKVYTAAATYTVTLVATNALGSNSITHSITAVTTGGGGGGGGGGTATSHQHKVSGSPLLNATNYTVKVEVRDAQGLTASDTEDFTTSWTAPTSPTASASVTNFGSAGYVDITFSNSARQSDWIAWRVYRRLDSTGAWVLVEETRIDQANYSIKDYLASSGVGYQYTAVQVATRSGGEVESNYTPTSTVTPTSTDYWLIVEDDPSFNIRLYHVVSDSFRDEVQSEEHELIGRGRKVDIGTALGYSGTLRFEIRDIAGGPTARQQRLNLEDLQRQTIYDVFLRNPFGDVFQVHTPSLSIERIAGVGMAEYVDCEFEYREVS